MRACTIFRSRAGLCNNRVVYLPITSVCTHSPRTVNPFGRTWERILSVTGQPNTAPLLERTTGDGGSGTANAGDAAYL